MTSGITPPRSTTVYPSVSAESAQAAEKAVTDLRKQIDEVGNDRSGEATVREKRSEGLRLQLQQAQVQLAQQQRAQAVRSAAAASAAGATPVTTAATATPVKGPPPIAGAAHPAPGERVDIKA